MEGRSGRGGWRHGFERGMDRDDGDRGGGRGERL
jgi:hypothetical protein